MPTSFIPREGFEGQDDFSGGLVLIGEPRPNQYVDSQNIEVRNRFAETRRGIRRALKNSLCTAFFFNEENAKFNDSTHTGFFFPFDWGDVLAPPIQGLDRVRFPKVNKEFFIVVSNGTVFIFGEGFLETVSTSEVIAATEEIEFVQAGAAGGVAGGGTDFVVMFRGEDKNPLRWDGTKTGFVNFPTAVTDDIQGSTFGIQAAGRLWFFRDNDDVFVSDIFDITNYDLVNQFFSIRKNNGDLLVAMILFHEDTVLMFKRRSVDAITGIFTGSPFVGGISKFTVDNKHGCAAKDSIVITGELVWYYSDRGFEQIQRNNENKLRGQDRSISASIQPIINRINRQEKSKITGITFDNYIFWGMPVDNATTNNAILVYDLLADDGRGNWIDLWKSPQTIPQKFFAVDEKLFFLGTDGALREMLTNDPWDSEDPFLDTPDHDVTKSYAIGDLVTVEVTGTDTIFRAITQNINTVPPNATFWEQVTDPQSLYDIQSFILTRELHHGDRFSEKRRGHQEIIVEHQNPKIDVFIKNKDFQTEQQVFTDKTYSQVKYGVTNAGFDKADWDASNVNLDFRDPHREDYTVFLRPGGILIDFAGEDLDDPFFLSPEGIIMDKNGLVLNVYETHALRFIRPLMNNFEYQLRIVNKQGKLRVRSVGSMARLPRYAVKER